MFGALGKDGFYMRPADALNSETFIEFLKELRRVYPKFAMMLDNTGYHKSRMVSRFIESTGGDIKLIYLPPHAPQLNLIGCSTWRSSACWPAGTLRAWTSSGTQLYKSCKTR